MKRTSDVSWERNRISSMNSLRMSLMARDLFELLMVANLLFMFHVVRAVSLWCKSYLAVPTSETIRGKTEKLEGDAVQYIAKSQRDWTREKLIREVAKRARVKRFSKSGQECFNFMMFNCHYLRRIESGNYARIQKSVELNFCDTIWD